MEAQHRHLQSMGTRLDMVFPGISASKCDQLLEQVQFELNRLDLMLSLYRSDSDLSILNGTAHAGTMEVDQELFSILQEVRRLHKESGGYFDITMKPVFDFYTGNPGEDQELPDAIRRKVGMDLLVLDQTGISLAEKGVVLDLGGYGKGYAVKRLVSIFEASAIESALISFGESLIYGLGTHPFGDSWKVSVPVGDSQGAVVFNLKNEALSTSGNSLNNQKKFGDSGHIVNPITLELTSRLGLVSVKAKDPVRAEVFSTALFSAGPERSGEISQGLSDVECKWV